MPARIKRTPGQEASAANHEWERFAGEMLYALWRWHDAVLADGDRQTAGTVFGILQSASCFIEEWGGITERINAIAHLPGAGGRAEEDDETVTDDSTPAVPAEPVSRPAKKRKKVIQ